MRGNRWQTAPMESSLRGLVPPPPGRRGKTWEEGFPRESLLGLIRSRMGVSGNLTHESHLPNARDWGDGYCVIWRGAPGRVA